MPPISLMKSHQHMPGLAAGRTWLPTQAIEASNPPDEIAFHGCAMQILEQHDRNGRSLLYSPIAAVLTAPPLKVKACHFRTRAHALINRPGCSKADERWARPNRFDAWKD